MPVNWADFRPKAITVLRILLLAVSLLLAFLLIFHCVDLYRSGTAAENRTANGALIEPVFSREKVAERLRQMAWAVWLWLGLLAANLAVNFGEKSAKQPSVQPFTGTCKPGWEAPCWLKWVLLVCALLLLVLGFFNGGIADVMVKAVNICTECIGLD